MKSLSKEKKNYSHSFCFSSIFVFATRFSTASKSDEREERLSYVVATALRIIDLFNLFDSHSGPSDSLRNNTLCKIRKKKKKNIYIHERYDNVV